MKVLVIGRTGQVAQALAAVGGEQVRCVGRPDVDLGSPASLQRLVSGAEEDVVINAAAYTDVDGAEAESDRAFLLNEAGPRELAAACRERRLPLIHLSTDCVFDGTMDRSYEPNDMPSPLGVYGQSKRAGEIAVMAACPSSLVVRVSWIFSQYANTFVHTMLRLAQSRETITVVSDQYGCPTYAPDLAEGLLAMAKQCLAPDFTEWGVYHLAGEGETSRADQARVIYDYSRAHNGPVANVIPVGTKDYPTPAQRPLNARLSMQKTTQVFGVRLRHWQEGMQLTVPNVIWSLAAS